MPLSVALRLHGIPLQKRSWSEFDAEMLISSFSRQHGSLRFYPRMSFPKYDSSWESRDSRLPLWTFQVHLPNTVLEHQLLPWKCPPIDAVGKMISRRRSVMTVQVLSYRHDGLEGSCSCWAHLPISSVGLTFQSVQSTVEIENSGLQGWLCGQESLLSK